MAKLSLCCKDEVSLSMLFNVGLFEVLWDEVVVHLEEQVLGMVWSQSLSRSICAA